MGKHERQKPSDGAGDEIVRANTPGKRLGAMVSVRLSPDEDAALRVAAEAQGMSISEFLRSALLRELGRAEPARRTHTAPSSNLPDMSSVQILIDGAASEGTFIAVDTPSAA